LFSCKKDFLNKIPESSLTTGNFPVLAADAESELTGAYDWMVYYTNFYQYDNYFNTDGKSDNCYLNSDNVTAEQPLEYFSTVTASNTNITISGRPMRCWMMYPISPILRLPPIERS
jgi:hypothetical protein